MGDCQLTGKPPWYGRVRSFVLGGRQHWVIPNGKWCPIALISWYRHRQRPTIGIPRRITVDLYEYIGNLSVQCRQDISRMLTLFREWYIKTNTELTLDFIFYLLQLLFAHIACVTFIVVVAAAVWHLFIKDHDDDDDASALYHRHCIGPLSIHYRHADIADRQRTDTSN